MEKDVLLVEVLRLRCETLKAAMGARELGCYVSSSFGSFDKQLASLSDKLIGEREEAPE